MRRLLYANLATRQPVGSPTGDAVDFPILLAGQDYTIALRWLDDVSGALTEIDPAISAIRASIGFVEAAPASGTWKIQIGSGSATADNTTSVLDWNASPTTVKNALNAVADGTEDYEVDFDNGSYLIRRTGGEAITLQIRANRLKPVSFCRVRATVVDGDNIYDVRLVQAPLAFTDSSELVLPEPPVIATVRDGGTDPSGTWYWNEIQSLTLPPDFRGTYQLRRNFARTDLLSIADGVAEISAALNSMLAPESASVRVTNPTSQVAHIEFQGELRGLDVDPLEVTVFSAPPGDITFTLDLNTSEIWAVLRERPAVVVPFELEADIYIDPDDHDAGTRTIKVWSQDVTIARPLAWEGLAAAQNIDWLRPPSPADYIPFTLDQVLTGQQQAFSRVIGNGTATSFTLDHNLDSELCQVIVRENSSPGRLLRPDEYEVELTDSNSLTISGFADTPTLSQYAAFVVAIGPESVFQSHTHTIEQIVGLQDALDNIGTRLDTLEAILPSTGPGAAATQASGITIDLPETKDILFFKGTPEELKGLFTDKGIDAAKLGRPPLMLPAIHDATATSYTTGDLPALAADTVWQNDSGATIDMGRGIYGGKVLDEGYFGSDARARYALTREGSTTSYFPTGFSRELFRIFINEKMLRLNRTLDVQFGLALQLLLATSNAQWLIVIEQGSAPEQSTPSTTGTNLENIVWDSTPILSQRLILTQNRQTHGFGVRIKRELVSSTDTITADSLLYGIWEGADAAAPASANFALRARLIQFDTENALAADARGWVSYEITGATASGKPTAIIV